MNKLQFEQTLNSFSKEKLTRALLADFYFQRDEHFMILSTEQFKKDYSKEEQQKAKSNYQLTLNKNFIKMQELDNWTEADNITDLITYKELAKYLDILVRTTEQKNYPKVLKKLA